MQKFRNYRWKNTTNTLAQKLFRIFDQKLRKKVKILKSSDEQLWISSSSEFYLLTCLYFLFIAVFVTQVGKALWRTLSLVMPFYFCISPRNTLHVFCIKMMWSILENVVPALFRRGIHVEYLWGRCWRLLLHWCLLHNKLISCFYSLTNNIYSVLLSFSFTF